jgi:hypothetical protein
VAITLSAELLDSMGFREIVAQAGITARFVRVTVYEVRGIVMPENFVHALPAQVAGAEYRVALARSVNDGCRALVDDDFTESEPAWRKEVKSEGPFALVALRPTEFFQCRATRAKRDEGGGITTYDGFPEVRAALNQLDQRVLPPLFAALTCALSELDHFVSLRKLGHGAVGHAPDGVTVRDLWFQVKGSLS